MCLAVLAHRYVKNRRLLLILNRDEYYQRPTQSIHHWNNSTGIVGPKDLISGGSFIGYNKYGQWITITNIRTRLKQLNKRSRGDIFKLYLSQKINAITFCNQLIKRAGQFNAFNALIGDNQQIFHLNSDNKRLKELLPGIYGLSNDSLDTPWPKLTTLKQKFNEVIQSPFQESDLWSILLNKKQFDVAQLPDTGIPIAREKLLSSIYIESEDYGTRSSYILSQTDRLTLKEKVYNP